MNLHYHLIFLLLDFDEAQEAVELKAWMREVKAQEMPTEELLKGAQNNLEVVHERTRSVDQIVCLRQRDL